MALTPKQRELLQRRKQAKRPKGSGPNLQSFVEGMKARELAKRFAHFPVHEALVPSQLFETGIGTPMLARRAPDGAIGLASVLLDVFCLGAKNALFRVVSEEEYEEMKAHTVSLDGIGTLETYHPSCWRKLVEGGVAYADDLGFDPHPDYREVIPMFGDIDPKACPQKFEYGKDGKPFYVSGPNDTPTRIRHIMKLLERRGVGNYDFMISQGDRYFGAPGD